MQMRKSGPKRVGSMNTGMRFFAVWFYSKACIAVITAVLVMKFVDWQTPIVVYGMGTADAGKNIAEGANLYKQRVEMLIGNSNAGNNW